mmetsp:Transcript_35217/g.90089  ORF Transcript_35217/g.90089 Transcript_35217/m.90089 type:complete len:262 (+) Transcript_35217:876-1661(+)
MAPTGSAAAAAPTSLPPPWIWQVAVPAALPHSTSSIESPTMSSEFGGSPHTLATSSSSRLSGLMYRYSRVRICENSGRHSSPSSEKNALTAEVVLRVTRATGTCRSRRAMRRSTRPSCSVNRVCASASISRMTSIARVISVSSSQDSITVNRSPCLIPVRLRMSTKSMLVSVSVPSMSNITPLYGKPSAVSGVAGADVGCGSAATVLPPGRAPARRKRGVVGLREAAAALRARPVGINAGVVVPRRWERQPSARWRIAGVQ